MDIRTLTAFIFALLVSVVANSQSIEESDEEFFIFEENGEEFVIIDGIVISMSILQGVEEIEPEAPPPAKRIRWDPATGPVFVCIHNPNGSANPNDDIYFRDMLDVIDNAATAWEKVSNINISIRPFSECDNLNSPAQLSPNIETESPTPHHIVIGNIERNAGALAAADHLGNKLDGRGSLIFKAEYMFNDRICGLRGTHGRDKCRYADALHEIGHLLGFSHDHISVNSPECEGRRVSGELTDAGMIYYDPHSIMNYCNRNRWDGILSPADICSVQVAYPQNDGRRHEYECFRIAYDTAALVASNR